MPKPRNPKLETIKVEELIDDQIIRRLEESGFIGRLHATYGIQITERNRLSAIAERNHGQVRPGSALDNSDMANNADAYGAELWDYFKTKDDKREIVERDDNFIDGTRTGYGGSVYFSDHKDWSPIEQKAIKHAHGRVIDIGCGAGRHALYLQKKGLDVTGIDSSPLAIRVCKLRGLKKARVLAFDNINKFKTNSFDTVILLGNNFGLFGGFKKAKLLLRKLDKITSAHATIIASTTDPYQTKNPSHRRYQELNRRRGRMPGQVRIRIRHGNLIGLWFDYLLASQKEVRQIMDGTGWSVKRFIESDGPAYAIVIDKKGEES